MNKQATLNKTLTIILTTTILLSIAAFNASVQAKTTQTLPKYSLLSNQAESNLTTLVLSNEEGGLINKLIDAGHGGDTLYAVLQLLQPLSNGAIPTDFMTALAASPANCNAKTSLVRDFSDSSNNPIGIGSDGSLIVAPIYGHTYDGVADFTTKTGNVAGVGNVKFTVADSEDDVIDAGAQTFSGTTYYFKAFAIVWMPNTVSTSSDVSGSVAPSSVSEGGLQVGIGWIVGAIIGVVVVLLVVWFLMSKRRKRHQ